VSTQTGELWMIKSKILGAILAGGRSDRFGTDKAMAKINGQPMIARIHERLAPQVTKVVVCGRPWAGLVGLLDHPRPGLGPLGGLAAALAYAELQNYSAVMSTGCDLPNLPLNLIEQLAPGPTVVQGQPLLGLWPTTFAEILYAYLERTDDFSMRSWLRHAVAREVDLGIRFANINTPADLTRFLGSTE
jgi:molybdopterin-guanine dinucleotide biosynthesis protein A